MSSDYRRFTTGETILYRGPFVDDAGREAPIICDVRPVVVVEDSETLVSLFLPAGTPTKMTRPLDRKAPRPWMAGEWELVDAAWDRWNTLHLIVPGDWHATWVMWSPEWRFLGWYVNFQEPVQRTTLGFDNRDLQLDILVDPARGWRWKDEDDLVRAVETGVISRTVSGRVQAEAQKVVRKIETGAWPFRTEWTSWRPDPSWPKPTLPARDYLVPDPAHAWGPARPLA